mgnify:CR=1 FL=1
MPGKGQFLFGQVQRRLGRVELRFALVVFGARDHLLFKQLLHARELALRQVITGLTVADL